MIFSEGFLQQKNSKEFLCTENPKGFSLGKKSRRRCRDDRGSGATEGVLTLKKNILILSAILIFLSLSFQVHAYWDIPEVWTAPFLVEITESYAGLRLGYNITPTVPIRLDNLTLGRFSQSVGIYVFRMSDGASVAYVPVYDPYQQSVNFTGDVILYPNDSYYITSAPSPYFTYSDIDPSYYPNVADGFIVNDAVYTADYGATWNPNINQAYDIQSIAYESWNDSFSFDASIEVRFWQDLNATVPYYNDFLWVYARMNCTWWEQFDFINPCNDTYFHAQYSNGSALIGVENGKTYDLYVLDGSVSWVCDTCPPNVTRYDTWELFDKLRVDGNITKDYFWNTTVSGQYPLFSNTDWNFWLSVAGIVILFIVVCLVAYFTQSGVATFLCMILAYILLKLFGILTGAIFFGLF